MNQMKDRFTNHILIVEDNPDHEILALRAAKSAGFKGTTTVARTGAAALLCIANNPDIGLVILDLNLPDRSGLDVIREVRRIHSTTLPVVIVSSSSQADDIRSAYEAGATSYVMKDGSWLKTCDTVENVVNYWTQVHLPV